MKILEMEHIAKQFGQFTALKDVSLQVEMGEVLGFIGPNGAGKTTSIRILLGILKASAGKASILGKDVWRDAVDIHKQIAYVPGDVNLWSNLTGGEVIDLFMKLKGANNKSRREELIERFDFDPTKKCRTYSKGNRQKVALVAAFASDAELYILDEPTSGLDPLMERVFQECVADIKANGKSVLLSSHILSEVEKLCDKVSIIRQGEIIETGTLDDLRHLTRMHMLVVSKQPIDGIEKWEGIHGLQRHELQYSFQVDNRQLGGIVKALGSYDLVKLESMPPTLEELFMSHYEDKGVQAHV